MAFERCRGVLVVVCCLKELRVPGYTNETTTMTSHSMVERCKLYDWTDAETDARSRSTVTTGTKFRSVRCQGVFILRCDWVWWTSCLKGLL